ncbi:TraC family protein [Aminobacter aganoensis]|uniref:Conjugal transfer protein TraC n=1 Tax=Aminobacter aganoensis TaxID=83264 RepID=A0A7X0FCT0_9HYPH|nr:MULTISPECIES: TraC family protein [Aminobacter]KQU72405.1 hypothetical protein ASC75_23765 [Aminobacter sp. DSM 101952]MBB6357305.1 hypothetical protein [Aminobacter aganoensis]
MRRPVAKIRLEIGRLQEQLRQAETREAERVGRLALRAGLCEIEVDDVVLVAELEKLASRFRSAPPLSLATQGKSRMGEQVISGAPKGGNGAA